jgi:hypothetical protein
MNLLLFDAVGVLLPVEFTIISYSHSHTHPTHRDCVTLRTTTTPLPPILSFIINSMHFYTFISQIRLKIYKFQSVFIYEESSSNNKYMSYIRRNIFCILFTDLGKRRLQFICF